MFSQQIFVPLTCISTCFFFLNLDTDEELKEWQMKFEERIAILESKICKLERELNDCEMKSSFLSQNMTDSVRDIGKLQAEADVFFLIFPMVSC